jgi:hypothetical protein
MSKEFNFKDWEITPEISHSPRRRQPKGEMFAKLWRWHLHLLLEKRASGRVLRFFLMLIDEDFKHFGEPFTVTTEMMRAAGIDRNFKAEILQTFEHWGFIFLERRANKNPRVFLRKRQGRGENPFHKHLCRRNNSTRIPVLCLGS